MEKLNKIFEEHKHWINEDCKNWEEMRADLSDADLSEANLLNADLRGANLIGTYLLNAKLRNADLCGACLSDADLSDADLSEANLLNADLMDADLCNVNLRGADLRGAKLRNADLRGVCLSRANLTGADLCNANLYNADLSETDLCGANLSDANLSGADFRGAKNVPYIPMVCPEEGDFIGWKKTGDKIVKLHIPQDALRSSATTRKCRCNKAEVVEIYNIDGTIADKRIVNSSYDSSFTYEVGKTVEVQDFDTNRWNECTKGIHFFINRQEAINY